MKKMKKYFLCVAVAAIAMVACDKSDVAVIEEYVPQNVPKNIMRFDSSESLLMEIERSLERAALPAEISLRRGNIPNEFVSFGELADMAYEAVALFQDEYKSLDEIKAAIAAYPDYLQLVDLGDGEYAVETKLYESPTRYIINEEKMYQIEETLVKTLEEATIFTDVENYRLLVNINNAAIANATYTENLKESIGLISINENIHEVGFINDVVVIGQSIKPTLPIVPPPTDPGPGRPSSHLGREVAPKPTEARDANGRNNRLTVKVYIVPVFVSGATITEYVAIDIRSHRKGTWGGFWWTMKRNIEYNIGVRVWYPNTFATRTIARTEYDWKIVREVGRFSHSNSSGHRAVIVGTNGYASSGVVTVPFSFGNF
jgi:hypothetical protein